MLNPINGESLSDANAKHVPNRQTRQARETDWTLLHSHPQEHALVDSTVTWLDGLPRPVRPQALAKRFPRIANQLCRLWEQPAGAKEYLQDLLIDRRGDRRGFPMHVTQELVQLKQYCRTLDPTRNDGRLDCR